MPFRLIVNGKRNTQKHLPLITFTGYSAKTNTSDFGLPTSDFKATDYRIPTTEYRTTATLSPDVVL